MKKLLMAASLVMLAACSTVGHKFDPNMAEVLKPGVTTVDQAVVLMGNYTGIEYLADGTIKVRWLYSQANGFTKPHADRVDVLFDKDRRMVRILGKASV